MKIIIATIKKWNIDCAKRFINENEHDNEFMLITENNDLQYEKIAEFNPDYIFFPHWSYIIPEKIYSKFKCIIFHMTDLPYGRGGSPLQNLIVAGHKETKLSAILAVKELDAGPIYMKKCLSLDGTAEDIYIRAAKLIFEEMLPDFLLNELEPVPQKGEVKIFKRRTPEQSRLLENMSDKEIYDYIRMLDAEGYPNAFVEYGDWKLTFTDAKLENGEISAKVLFGRK